MIHRKAKKVFRDNLLRLMKESGMNGAQLSRRLGYHPSAVCLYTSGKEFPRVPALWMIARALNTTMDELMDGYTEDDYDDDVEVLTWEKPKHEKTDNR